MISPSVIASERCGLPLIFSFNLLLSSISSLLLKASSSGSNLFILFTISLNLLISLSFLVPKIFLTKYPINFKTSLSYSNILIIYYTCQMRNWVKVRDSSLRSE